MSLWLHKDNIGFSISTMMTGCIQGSPPSGQPSEREQFESEIPYISNTYYFERQECEAWASSIAHDDTSNTNFDLVLLPTSLERLRKKEESLNRFDVCVLCCVQTKLHQPKRCSFNCIRFVRPNNCTAVSSIVTESRNIECSTNYERSSPFVVLTLRMPTIASDRQKRKR